jgi:hypothetical protein
VRDDLKLLGEVFDSPKRVLARLKPDGFSIGEETHPVLRGVVTDWKMVRKLFRKGKVVCLSEDGVEGTGAARCEKCRREGCSPRIRLHVEPVAGEGLEGTVVAVELNFSSCRNFLEYARDLGSQHHGVHEVVSVLSVEERGRWGEVTFAANRQPLENSPFA